MDNPFLLGVQQFNDRLFFEAHDTWEEIWSEDHTERRLFLQGLIQVAVGTYHAVNGNRKGAVSQLSKAMEKLRPYPDQYHGIHLDRFRDRAEALLAAVQTTDGIEFEILPVVERTDLEERGEPGVS